MRAKRKVVANSRATNNNSRARIKASQPIVIAEWTKNNCEIVRVILQIYRGKRVLSIRTWYRDGDGQFQPGKNGINLAVKRHLPKLIKSLKQAKAKLSGV